MITSKTCQIAIRALVYLAHNNEGKSISIDILHRELSVGAAYLTKVMQPLTKAGILSSTRGTNGGLLLIKKPSEITVYDIFALIDGTDLLETCALGIPTCSEETPCAIHSYWVPIRTDISNMFKKTTILDLKKSDGSF